MLCLHCAGQNSGAAFRAGLWGGVAVSEINGAHGYGNSFHKIGLAGGFLVNAGVSKKDVVQLEINYLQCGSLQPPDSLNNGYYNIALDYIEIPILIRHRVHFTVRKKPVDKVGISAGVSLGRLIKEKVIGNTNNVVYGNSAYYNNTIASILVGAEYNISENLYFCLRYSNSVIPAIKRNPLRLATINYTFNKGNNMILQFSFKYVFSAKKEETAPKVSEE